MTDNITDIVDVTITREAETVSQQGFGIPLILSLNKHWNERVRFYASLSAVVTDGFTSSTPEYLAASVLFSQSPGPVQIAIGRRSVDSVLITVSTVDDTHLYSVTIDGTACTYQAQSGDSGTVIASGLSTAINTAALGVTATPSTNTLTLAADVANTAYTLVVGTDLTLSALVASDSIANDLTAINIYNSSWYGLISTSRNATDVQNTAVWVEANLKIFLTASSDVNILSSGSTTDIAYILKAANYNRTAVIYDANAATQFVDAAWLGAMLPTQPGSVNWAYKTLSGVTPSTLTATQRTAALDKNCNTYEVRGGVNVTRLGTMASGQYIDITVGLDWLTTTMQAAVYSALVNLPKIPYTVAGMTIIQGYIMQALNQAVLNSVLSSDTPPTVTMPSLASITTQDKATRTLPGIKFSGVLAGAINNVQINGYITV